MGAWGTAIFSDDTAVDVRDGFRELLGAGLDAVEATDRVVEWSQLKPPGDPYEGAGWIGLAVTQWKLGCLVERVRDAALTSIEVELASPIFDGKDVAKRAAVLAAARDQILSPQAGPTKVSRKRVSQTPFAEGDMVRFTSATGREAAFWILQNRVREGIAGPSGDSFLRVWAIGDLELPSFEELIASEPLVSTSATSGATNAYRTWIQGSFLYPQDAVGPQWTVLGNAPYAPPPGGDSTVGLIYNFVRAVRPSSRDGTFDDYIERWFAGQQQGDPLVAPVQRLCDVVPGLPGYRTAWNERPLERASTLAAGCGHALERGEPAVLKDAFRILDDLLAGDPYDREVALEVLTALANLATHPTIDFDRSTLQTCLGGAALAELPALDAAWANAALKPTASTPTDPFRDQLLAGPRNDSRWTGRTQIRMTNDGQYLTRPAD